MRWTPLLIIVTIGLGSVQVPSALAESRPLKQLPADVVRWSTLWVEVPKQVYEVGQEEGPLAAMTWGPVKGTAVFVNSTAKELWDATKPDQRPGHQLSGKRPAGAIVRYEF